METFSRFPWWFHCVFIFFTRIKTTKKVILVTESFSGFFTPLYPVYRAKLAGQKNVSCSAWCSHLVKWCARSRCFFPPHLHLHPLSLMRVKKSQVTHTHTQVEKMYRPFTWEKKVPTVADNTSSCNSAYLRVWIYLLNFAPTRKNKHWTLFLTSSMFHLCLHVSLTLTRSHKHKHVRHLSLMSFSHVFSSSLSPRVFSIREDENSSHHLSVFISHWNSLPRCVYVKKFHLPSVHLCHMKTHSLTRVSLFFFFSSFHLLLHLSTLYLFVRNNISPPTHTRYHSQW